MGESEVLPHHGLTYASLPIPRSATASWYLPLLLTPAYGHVGLIILSYPWDGRDAASVHVGSSCLVTILGANEGRTGPSGLPWRSSG